MEMRAIWKGAIRRAAIKLESGVSGCANAGLSCGNEKSPERSSRPGLELNSAIEPNQRADWKVSTAAVTRALIGVSVSFTEAAIVSEARFTSAR